MSICATHPPFPNQDNPYFMMTHFPCFSTEYLNRQNCSEIIVFIIDKRHNLCAVNNFVKGYILFWGKGKFHELKETPELQFMQDNTLQFYRYRTYVIIEHSKSLMINAL